MPKVSKVKKSKATAKPAARKGSAKRVAPKSGGNVLDRIQPVGLTTKGYKINVYGKSGSGKTVFACSAPKPLLIIGTEDGTQSVSDLGDQGVSYVPLEATEELATILPHARENFKTVVLDTASMFQDLVLKELLGLTELPAQRSWGMASHQQWGQVALKCKESFRAILDLADAGVNVVVVAQERTFGDSSDGMDELAPSVASALSPSVSGWLNAACDYIVQTFLRREQQRSVTEIGGEEIETFEPTGKVEWCLRVGPHPVYTVKFRLPKGVNYPDVIVDPTFDKVAALIEGARG